MDVTQKKNIIVFFLIIVLALFIGYNGIYKYGLNRIDMVRRNIEEEKKKNEILEIIAILDNRLQKYQERSFATTEITSLLDRISDLAKEVDISVETYNPQSLIYKDQYIELPLQIPIRCEYHRLGELLGLIESSQEFIWVKQLNIQKPTVTDPKEARTPEVSLTISGLHLRK